MSEQFNEFGPFAVGEVCRIVKARLYPELIGTEVTITGVPCFFIDSNSGVLGQGYPTNLIHKGMQVLPREDYLRRRKPPATDSNERMYVQKWRDMAGKAPQRVGETV